MLAGTTAPVNMRKQNRVAEWAGRRGLPLICLSDNDGGRLPDLLGWRFSSVPFDFTSFLQSPAGFAEVPRVTAILGESYGDAALHAAMASYVVMRKDTAIALSGPPVIRAAIGEDVEADELGGPAVSADTNGSAHAVVEDEDEAIDSVKRFLGLLPRLGRAARTGLAARRAEPRPRRDRRSRPRQRPPWLRHATRRRVARRRRVDPALG